MRTKFILISFLALMSIPTAAFTHTSYDIGHILFLAEEVTSDPVEPGQDHLCGYFKTKNTGYTE